MTYKTVTPAFDTVYEILDTANVRKLEGTSPSIEVSGAGTVNLYISNKETQPVDETEMTLDTSSPLTSDLYSFVIQSKWVLFKIASGTPIVNTVNFIKG